MIDINLRIDLPIGGVSVEVPIRASVVVKAFAGRVHTSRHNDSSARVLISVASGPHPSRSASRQAGMDRFLRRAARGHGHQNRSRYGQMVSHPKQST